MARPQDDWLQLRATWLTLRERAREEQAKSRNLRNVVALRRALRRRRREGGRSRGSDQATAA